MKSMVRPSGAVKPFGAQSKVDYPISEWEVGDEIEIVDINNKVLNVAIVLDVNNGVVIEMVA